MFDNSSLILAVTFNTLVSFIYVLNTYSLGYIICRSARINDDNGLIIFILRWALGWNILVFFVHILGILSILNFVAYLILSTSGLFLFIVFERKTLLGNFPYVKKTIAENWIRLIHLFLGNKFIVGLLLLFVFMMYIISLAPVSKTDELNYYYYFVKRIVNQGGIVFDYYQVISFQPMAQILWYVPVYGLSATEAPSILNIYTSLLIIIVSYSWLVQYTHNKLALLAILATYLNLNGISNYPAPQDNVATWLWGLTSLIVTYEFLYSEKLQRNYTLFLSMGIIYVSACLVKLTNLPLIFLCLFAVLYKSYSDKLDYRQLTLLFIPFLVLYTPFLIRIYIWAGNPFFPSLSGIFGSTTFDVEALNVYLQRPSHHWNNNFIENVYYIGRMFRHTILFNANPLLTILSPFALFYLIYKKKYLIGSIAIMYMIIMLFAPASWRLMCGFLSFLILIIFVLDNKFIKKKIALNIVQLHAIFLVLITLVYFFQFGKYVFGFETKKDFLKTKIQTYNGIEWANLNLRKDSRILTTTREKYYFNFPVYTLSEYPLVLGEDARKEKDIESIYRFLKGHRVTHLFIATSGKGFNKDYVELLYQVGKTYGKMIYEEENATIKGVRHPLKKPLFGKLRIYEI